MAYLPRILFDELETYSTEFVDEQLAMYNHLPAHIKPNFFFAVKHHQAFSRNISRHVLELVDEVTPLAEDRGPQRNSYLYLLMVAHYRLNNIQRTLQLLDELNYGLPIDARTQDFTRFLRRKLRTWLALRVTASGAQAVVVVGVAYLGCRLLGPPLARGVKKLVKNNLVLEAHKGKIGLLLRFPEC